MPPKSKRRPAPRSPAQQSPQPAHAARAQATPPLVLVEALPAEPTTKSDEAQAAAVAEHEQRVAPMCGDPASMRRTSSTLYPNVAPSLRITAGFLGRARVATHTRRA
eukprot:COSAG06_NODE_2812_length_6243_cov_16.051921_6_plen_107_part_00